MVLRADSEEPQETQHRIEIYERDALAALYVLNTTSPAFFIGRRLAPETDDEGSNGS